MALNKNLGTRHRAGVGISEVSDSFTIIVSEETGNVSVAKQGKLDVALTKDELKERLKGRMQHGECKTEKNNMEGMGKESGKNLMNKFTLRILSLFIAIFIWLLVVNIEDPVRTITITDVPVTFANESYIESMNKVALMEDGKDTVDVKVTGASSIMKKISRDNISAVADLTQIVDLESDPIMVPVYVSYSGIEEHNIEARPRNIPITIENRVESGIYNCSEYRRYETGKRI